MPLLRARGREVTVLDGDVVRTHLSAGPRLQPRGPRHERPARRLRGRRGRAPRRPRRGRAREPVPRHARRGPRAWSAPGRASSRSSWTRRSRSSRQRDVKGWYAKARAGEVTRPHRRRRSLRAAARPGADARHDRHDRRGERAARRRLPGGARPSSIGRRLPRDDEPDRPQLADHARRDLLVRARRWISPTGSQVVAVDRLASRPFDPGMALVILPSRRRPDAGAADAAACPDATPTARDPVALLRRLYPSDHPVLGVRAEDATTVGAARRLDELSASAARAAPARPGRQRGQPVRHAWLVGPAPPARRLSLGPRAGPPDAAAVPARGDLRGLRRARGRLDAEARRGARATCCSRSSSTPSTRPRRASSTWPTSSARSRRRSSAAIRTSSATSRRDTPTEVMRNWEQLKAGERAADGTADGADGGASRATRTMPAAFAGLSRSLPALAYADEMQERAAAPRLRLARPRGRHRQGRRGGDASCSPPTTHARARRGVRRPAVRHRQPRPQAGHRPRGLAARREPQVRVPLRAGRAARRPSGAASCGPWASTRSTSCGRKPSEKRPRTRASRGRRDDEHRRRHALSRRRAHAGAAAPGLDRAGRPEVGRRLAASIRQGDTHVALRGHDRGPHPAAPARQGHGLGDRRVRDAAGARRRSACSASRSRAGSGGRTYEIQRLIGRSLRGVVDTAALGRAHRDHRLRRPPGRRRHALRVDHRRLRRARAGAAPDRAWSAPSSARSRAVSVGIVDGTPLLDLDYTEDSHAEVDFNVVGTDAGHVRRGPGHRRGQALRPRRRWTSSWRSPTAASRSSSSPERSHRARHRAPLMARAGRGAPASEPIPHERPRPAPRDPLAPQARRAARRCSTCPTSTLVTPLDDRHRRRARGGREHVPRQCRSSRPATTPRAPACRRWPTTRGWRWTRWMAARACARSATPVPTRPTRRTTR